MSDSPFLSLSVLAYNEEASLGRAASLCSEVLEGCEKSYELVLINDGSTDATPRIAEALAAELPHCRVIHHPRNLGIGAGIRTAYFGTHGRWAVWFPADLQADPRELPRLLPHLEGCDVLVTYRDAGHRQESRLRKLISLADRTLVRLLLGLKVRDLHWVRFLRREVLRRMALSAWSPGVDTEMLACARLAGARIREAPLPDRRRTAGQARGASVRNLAGAVRDLVELYRRGPRLVPPGREGGNCPWLSSNSFGKDETAHKPEAPAREAAFPSLAPQACEAPSFAGASGL
jgi:glycosyltransferase involved in cell wall biosynthesis